MKLGLSGFWSGLVWFWLSWFGNGKVKVWYRYLVLLSSRAFGFFALGFRTGLDLDWMGYVGSGSRRRFFSYTIITLVRFATLYWYDVDWYDVDEQVMTFL
ncbi:uncharacterized protein J3D65DRAFT_112047 [Phyllosticta citribraziliensis]|uniref:Uncharacterized protein n=1 Tax=Phyllosticta citribraziliensis TaxID=989973 RepID=A0ABR1LBZ3_9PEZI